MRTVLDTNVLVSACWKPDGLEARTVALAIDGAFTACLSPEIVVEYRDVLSRRKLAALRDRADAILAALERASLMLQPTVRVTDARDEDDNRFLECACAANADFLVTGNLRHYPQHCGSTRIVNARAFLTACFRNQLDAMERNRCSEKIGP